MRPQPAVGAAASWLSRGLTAASRPPRYGIQCGLATEGYLPSAGLA